MYLKEAQWHVLCTGQYKLCMKVVDSPQSQDKQTEVHTVYSNDNFLHNCTVSILRSLATYMDQFIPKGD